MEVVRQTGCDAVWMRPVTVPPLLRLTGPPNTTLSDSQQQRALTIARSVLPWPTSRPAKYRRKGIMKTDLNDLIVVCGGGGFIGGHLVADLVRQGHRRIRAVDIKTLPDWYQLV